MTTLGRIVFYTRNKITRVRDDLHIRTNFFNEVSHDNVVFFDTFVEIFVQVNLKTSLQVSVESAFNYSTVANSDLKTG